MANPVLAITDGTTRVNLLVDGTTGIGVCDWTPARPTFKDDGVWANSSISDGRQLQMRKWTNIIDVFTINISDCSQDRIIAFSRSLTALLEKAVQYWTTEWQNEPVWIERRGAGETNISYSLINSYKWASDDNPFEPPFYGVGAQLAMAEIELAIEHGAWLSNPPGESECVEISNIMSGEPTSLTVVPTQSEDDATVTHATNSISLISDKLIFDGDNYSNGIRFRNVTIPRGSTIVAAYLKLYESLYPHDLRIQRIYGELNATPSAFSTYADFVGRTKTSSYESWELPDLFFGGVYTSPNIKSVIQEIVDLGGWISGNDLAIIIESIYTPAGDVGRWLASWDNTLYHEPELVIMYANPSFGRESTCSGEVYVSNKDNTAMIDYVYGYDAPVGYGDNLILKTPPFDFFTAPLFSPSLYIGSTYGPFCSVVFDIGTVGNTTFAWEYWDGAAWASLTVVTDRVGYDDFTVSGVGALSWEQPSDWTVYDIAGTPPSAYWIRARLLSGTISPAQQNRSIYTVINSDVEIDEDEINGDIPAIAKINTVTLDTTRGEVEKLLIGIRSVSRGEDFRQHINTDLQNNAYITITADVDTAIQADLDRPTGSGLQTQFTAPDTIQRRLYFEIDNPLAQQYYGRYRAFMRGQEVTATPVLSDGEVQSYLNVSLGSSTASKTVGNIGIGDDWYYFDYGIITIPPALIPEAYYGTVQIDVYASSDCTSAADFDWVDLILFPVDEYALEIQQDTGSIANVNDITTVDSLSYIGKSNVFSVLRDESTYEIKDIPLVIASAPIQLQAGADQRVYFFVPDASKYEWLGRIQMWKNERYLTFRGDS